MPKYAVKLAVNCIEEVPSLQQAIERALHEAQQRWGFPIDVYELVLVGAAKCPEPIWVPADQDKTKGS